MKGKFLISGCSLVLMLAAAGSASASDPSWKPACPADSEEECKKAYGWFDKDKEICKVIKRKEADCKDPPGFTATVKIITVFKKDEWGNCVKKRDVKFVSCENPQGHPMPTTQPCEVQCVVHDD